MEDYFSFFGQTQVVGIHHSTAHRFITHRVKLKVAKLCKSLAAVFPSSKGTFCGSLTSVNKSLFSITTGTMETPWTEPRPPLLTLQIPWWIAWVTSPSAVSFPLKLSVLSVASAHLNLHSSLKKNFGFWFFGDFSSFLVEGQGRNVCFSCKGATHPNNCEHYWAPVLAGAEKDQIILIPARSSFSQVFWVPVGIWVITSKHHLPSLILVCSLWGWGW